MRCKICGGDNLEDAKYCEQCGSPIHEKLEIDEHHTHLYVKEKHGFATASMILGIISLVCSTVLCCFAIISQVISLICGLLAIIFAILGWKTYKKQQAIVGLICAIIGILFAILFFALVIISPVLEEFIKNNYPDIWEQIKESQNY